MSASEEYLEELYMWHGEEPICGDHLQPMVECGCYVYFNYKRKRVSK